jgi:hypothetical protein
MTTSVSQKLHILCKMLKFIASFMLTLFAQLYERVDILFKRGKHVDDRRYTTNEQWFINIWTSFRNRYYQQELPMQSKDNYYTINRHCIYSLMYYLLINRHSIHSLMYCLLINRHCKYSHRHYLLIKKQCVCNQQTLHMVTL